MNRKEFQHRLITVKDHSDEIGLLIEAVEFLLSVDD